jgi:cell wall-associated NlpC family hydrolase
MKSLQPYIAAGVAALVATAQASILVLVVGAAHARPPHLAIDNQRTLMPPEQTPAVVWLRGEVAGLGVARVDNRVIVVGAGDRIELALPAARRESAGLGAAQVALAALGAPYQWGSVGVVGARRGASGFDCSGLIWHAFARQGITLPRVSREQARAGVSVPRVLYALEPGDLLAFSRVPGGPVEHVGLYVGAGRFVHSSGWDGGVVVSRLAPNDQRGRWWWRRWVGARRVTTTSL